MTGEKGYKGREVEWNDVSTGVGGRCIEIRSGKGGGRERECV